MNDNEPGPTKSKIVHALIDGRFANSLTELVAGAVLSFDDAVHAGDTVVFGGERFRAVKGAPGEIALEPVRVRFADLAALLPALERGEGANELLEIADGDGCTLVFVDWSSHVPSARTYLQPGRVETADLDVCRKLLTILVREARFDPAGLRWQIEQGYAARIVRRIAELTLTTPAPVCPACGSLGARRILRGYPTKEGQEAANRGDVVLGGCMVMGDGSDTVWCCRKCGHEFGRMDRMIDVATDILHDMDREDAEKE